VRTTATLAGLLVLPLWLGCGAAYQAGYWVGMPFLYREAPLPGGSVVRDVPYRTDEDADPVKHRLDLFLPAADARPPSGWPVLVFVHGGGWTTGDKALRAGGRDVYANIGRYFAARGIAVAVVNYRLQFDATLEDQIADVADAVAWVHGNAARYGGDPDALFVAGHSAGAQLAAYVAMSPDLLPARGVEVSRLCGIIPVSGGGFDLADERTYELGGARRYYEKRFHNGSAGDSWKRDASLVRFARAGLPPVLILYPENDFEALKRQGRLLDEALRAAGAESRLVEVEGSGHSRVVLTLSRPDREAADVVESFIRGASCGG